MVFSEVRSLYTVKEGKC